MLRTHHHDSACPPECSRERDIDATTPTGSYQIAVSREGLKRAVEKPRWWPFVLIGFKQAVNVLSLIVLAYILKRLGLVAP